MRQPQILGGWPDIDCFTRLWIMGIVVTAHIRRVTGCRLWDMIVDCGYRGDRGYWAVDRVVIIASDWGSGYL